MAKGTITFEFESLPDFLKDKIRLSPEYAHATNGAQHSEEYSDEYPDDDIPF